VRRVEGLFEKGTGNLSDRGKRWKGRKIRANGVPGGRVKNAEKLTPSWRKEGNLARRLVIKKPAIKRREALA